MNNTPFSIRLPAHLRLADLDAKAKQQGLTRAGYAVKAVELLMGFDDVFLAKMEAYAKGLKIPLFLVMQNMLIKRMAQEAAEVEVWGPRRRLLDEFMFTNEGAITGEELFRKLKVNFVEEERRAYDEAMGERVHVKMASGIELSDEEKTWVESFEQAAKRVQDKELIREQLEEELENETESFDWNLDDESK